MADSDISYHNRLGKSGQGENEMISKIVDDELKSDDNSDEDLRIILDFDEDVDSPAPATPSSDTSARSVKSVIDCLHRPTSSELSRKRKVDRNPPRGKKRSRGTCASDPKSITPQQRVKQYNDECFSVANNKLFCLACREELSIKNSVIIGHIKSSKHNAGKDRLQSQKKRDMEIMKPLKYMTVNSPKRREPP